MPSYTFHNPETDEYETIRMSMADRDQYVKDNPHLQQVFNFPAIIEERKLSGFFDRGLDSTFKSRLNQIHKNHYGSQMRTHNLGEI